MGTLSTAMHVVYGASWGVVYGVAQSSLDLPAAQHGGLFGTLVWGVSLVQLPAMKIAPPIW